MLSQQLIQQIDKGIHANWKHIFINGKAIPVLRSNKNSCKFVKYDNIIFMEQNRQKRSIYAEMAQQGHTITWGIRQIGKWILIIDNVIQDY